MKHIFLFLKNYVREHKILCFFFLLLALHIFFRFYKLFERASLGWDQVDSAWAAKSILVDKNYWLKGPVVKGNSGIYMGPLYYYLITPFYALTNLDPIASAIFAGITSIISFFVLYFVTQKIFDSRVALIAAFINTFSVAVMSWDRVPSAANFIVPISYVIFYFLYKVITGNPKYILHLAIATGLSFHVDFTSVFYPICILLALPLFPRNKKTLYCILVSLPVFFLFLVPSVARDVHTGRATFGSLFSYIGTYFHGIHLRRIVQLAHDAFISFEGILQFRILRPFVFFFLPLFIVLYYWAKPHRHRLLLGFLMVLWVVAPWLTLSAYSGELTFYYFSMSRDIAIAILAFLTVFFFSKRQWAAQVFLIVFWIAYAWYGVGEFLQVPNGNLLNIENGVRSAIGKNETIPFKDKDPYAYVYYVYTRYNKKN